MIQLYDGFCLIVNLVENDCGKTVGASNDKPVCQLNKNIVIADNRMGKQRNIVEADAVMRTSQETENRELRAEN